MMHEADEGERGVRGRGCCRGVTRVAGLGDDDPELSEADDGDEQSDACGDSYKELRRNRVKD